MVGTIDCTGPPRDGSVRERCDDLGRVARLGPWVGEGWVCAEWVNKQARNDLTKSQDREEQTREAYRLYHRAMHESIRAGRPRRRPTADRHGRNKGCRQGQGRERGQKAAATHEEDTTMTEYGGSVRDLG